jgi:hypothetical protein
MMAFESTLSALALNVLKPPFIRRSKLQQLFVSRQNESPHGTGGAGLQFVVDPSAKADTQGRPDAYAQAVVVMPVIVPVISVMVPVPVINLSQVAVGCRIDLYRRSLRHGLAWRWHGKNNTSRNGRGHGQYFDANHDKILLFSLRTQTP